jgi:hypothetical protein
MADDTRARIEITTVKFTAEEWAERDGTPGDPDRRDMYVIAEHVDVLAEWVYPGDPRYPADTMGFELDDQGGVWLDGTPVDAAAVLLNGRVTQFWADEYVGDGNPFVPGGEYVWVDEHPYTGDVEYKTARVLGFSPLDEAKIYQAWKR